MKIIWLPTVLGSLILSSVSLAAERITFYNKSLPQALSAIQINAEPATGQRRTPELTSTLMDKHYQLLNRQDNARTNLHHHRFQQQHHGLRVMGGNVTLHFPRQVATPELATKSRHISDYPQETRISGQFIQGIDEDIDTNDILLYQHPDSLALTMSAVTQQFRKQLTEDSNVEPVSQECVIGTHNGKAQLMHQVSFYAKGISPGKRRLITMIVNPSNPAIVFAVWDNIQHRTSNNTGLGGNSKTLAYTYNQNNNPSLVLNKRGAQCYLENDDIQVVNALQKPHDDNYRRTYHFHCDNQKRDTYRYCTTQPWWLSTIDTLMADLFAEIFASDGANDLSEFDWDNGDWEWETEKQFTQSPSLHKHAQPVSKAITTQTRHNQRQSSLLTTHAADDDAEELAEPVCYSAYSQANDAFYFGQTVHDMYQDWYSSKVLSDKLVLRVHVGTEVNKKGEITETFPNAYWDPKLRTMNFGDGMEDRIYPLVSLDVLAHEVSHGFTQDHANLSYYEQTGSLNEAYSDMAGAATMAYLREKQPNLYHQIYHTDEMVWKIGSTLFVTPFDGFIGEDNPNLDHDIIQSLDNFTYSFPIRFLDQPSRDSFSADCFDKIDGCLIDYQTMRDGAYAYGLQMAELTCDLDERELCIETYAQSAIVHEGSGIFNRAFYLLANHANWSVRKAFDLMLTANRDGYWIDTGLQQENFSMRLPAPH